MSSSSTSRRSARSAARPPGFPTCDGRLGSRYDEPIPTPAVVRRIHSSPDVPGYLRGASCSHEFDLVPHPRPGRRAPGPPRGRGPAAPGIPLASTPQLVASEPERLAKTPTTNPPTTEMGRPYDCFMLVGRPGLSPVMVGRGAELDRLARLPDPEDAPSVALLGGEAGIGKTRLVRELCERLPADTRVIAGQADPGALGRPFELLLDALKSESCVNADLMAIVTD